MEVIKQGENFLVDFGGILMSHNIGCDNKYLEVKQKW